jgi:hypothetical protein
MRISACYNAATITFLITMGGQDPFKRQTTTGTLIDRFGSMCCSHYRPLLGAHMCHDRAIQLGERPSMLPILTNARYDHQSPTDKDPAAKVIPQTGQPVPRLKVNTPA